MQCNAQCVMQCNGMVCCGVVWYVRKYVYIYGVYRVYTQKDIHNGCQPLKVPEIHMKGSEPIL